MLQGERHRRKMSRTPAAYRARARRHFKRAEWFLDMARRLKERGGPAARISNYVQFARFDNRLGLDARREARRLVRQAAWDKRNGRAYW